MPANKRILIGQRGCRICLHAAKMNTDMGSPFSLKYITDKTGFPALDRVIQKEHTMKMPLIAIQRGRTIFFSEVARYPGEMRGFLKEISHPGDSEEMNEEVRTL